MPSNPLAKKIKLDSAKRAAIINAPNGYLASLKPLPKDLDMLHELKGKFDWIQIFVSNKADLERLMPKVMKTLGPECRVWITFPKGSSKVQTDLTRDKGWESLKDIDLKWINLVSINDTWSAFALRTYKRGEEKQAYPWANR